MARALVVVVGVSIGVLLGIGLFAWLDDDPPGPAADSRPVEVTFPPVDHDPAAATELLAAWAHWRSSTFYARGTWERRLDDDGSEPLRGSVLRVQDPPRRLVVRLGSVVEMIDGAVRSCDSGVEGAVTPPCVTPVTETSYDERVAAELATVTSYVEGDRRPFDVGRGTEPGCFRVENRAGLAAASWGLWAEFCFDDTTGALRSARVRRASAVDTEVTIEIRGEVTEADFGAG